MIKRINLPKIRFLSGLVLILVASFLFFACSSSSPKTALEVSPDAPEICRDVDFEVNKNLRDICGVQVRNYRSYKNIVEYRMLTRPKDGQIVKKGNHLELRLPKMQPVELPGELKEEISFSEKDRLTFIKTQWEYLEFFPDNSTDKLKLMKIIIPHQGSGQSSLCYEIITRSSRVSEVQSGFASKLIPLKCEKFEKYNQSENENNDS